MIIDKDYFSDLMRMSERYKMLKGLYVDYKNNEHKFPEYLEEDFCSLFSIWERYDIKREKECKNGGKD